VQSIAGQCARAHFIKCAQAHVIALKTHGAAGGVMVARATRADKACARSRPLGSSLVRSSTLAGARSSLFTLFHLFNRSLNARTCNTMQH
jgi:hypothetical protein